MAHPFEITAEEIGQLDGTQLPRLINRLLEIESGRAGLQQSALELCDNSNIPDGGVDAFLDAGDLRANRFLPAGRSVWQYKAGIESWKSLRKEIEKPSVKEALESGGTYVLVVGRSVSKRQRDKQKPQFIEALAKVGPGLRFKLRSQEQVAEWATARRAAMFHLGRNMGGFEEVEQVLQLSVHAHRFTPDAQRADIRETFRAWAEDPAGSPDLRLYGQAGVGKTRLALEAANQRLDAIYSPAPRQEAREFLQWMVAHESVSGIAVVDECSALEAEQLAERVELSNGRITLVTIGRDRIPGADWQFPLDPLDDESMREFVQGVAPSLSRRQLSWVIELAGGYVKLARLLALETAKHGPDTPLWQMDIGQLLERMVPDRDQRRALTVVSLLSHVGWEGDVANEGELVAKVLEVDWKSCREQVLSLEEQELIGRDGRYVYATPELLAIWLSAHAWQAHGEALLQVRQSLDGNGQKRFDNRLGSMQGVERAEQLVEDVLSGGDPFRDLGVLAANAGLFSALAKVAPGAAVRSLERIILPLDSYFLRGFTSGRREIMWALERLVAHPKLFPTAANLILRLAVAENESYANNATSTFQSLFKPRGGATAATGDERIRFLEDRIERSEVPELLIVVGALNQAFDVHGAHVVSPDPSGVAPPMYWAARTLEEHINYCGRAFELLEQMLVHDSDQVRSAAESVVLERFRNLFWLGLSEQVLSFVARSDLSESVRRRLPLQVDDILLYDEDKAFMTPELRDRLQDLQRSVYADPLRERLHLQLGSWRPSVQRAARESSESFYETESQEMEELAKELLQNPEVLREEFEWITSEEAVRRQGLFSCLGELDRKREWLAPILEASVESTRLDLISSYVFGLSRSAHGRDLEDLLDQWAADDRFRHIVPHITNSLGLSERRAMRLVNLLDDGLDPQFLVYILWAHPDYKEDPLHFETFAELLRRMALDGGHSRGAAWNLAGNVFTRHQREGWTDTPAAFELLWFLIQRFETSDDFDVGAAPYHWAECAKLLAKRDPQRLVSTIVQAVLDSRELPHLGTYVREVLQACFDADSSLAWTAYADGLADPRSGAWVLEMWGAEADITERVGLDVIRTWVDEASKGERDHRAETVAKLTRVGTNLTPLIRWIVTEFEQSERILDELAIERGVQFAWGSMADTIQPRLDAAGQWSEDANPAIRRWAQRIVDDLEQEVAKYRLMDEEADIRR